jgi:putative copper resistance protein D
LRSRKPRYWLAGLGGIAGAALAWLWLLAVPAHPTTYAGSPVRYTTEAIARGAVLYAQRCSECHGIADRRDTQASSARPPPSPHRIDYDKYRYPGDLFWLIAHGIPGTAMPEFTPHLSEDDIWALLQFLRARSEANAAMTLTDRVDPWRPIVAPDFTFEIAGGPQQSLRQRTGPRPTRGAALVVLYTLPASRQRLDRLAAHKVAFANAGARVIVLPLAAAPPSSRRENDGGGEPTHAIARPDVAATYAMFARRRTDADSEAPTHAELLIDRQGYLRARWIGVPDATTNQTTDVLGQIEALNREPDEPARTAGH